MEFVWTRSQRIRLHMYHLYNYIYAFSCRRRPVRSPLLVFYLFCILSFVLVFPNATVSGRCLRTVAVTFSVCSSPVFPLRTTTFFPWHEYISRSNAWPSLWESICLCLILGALISWRLAEDEVLSGAVSVSGYRSVRRCGVQGPLA